MKVLQSLHKLVLILSSSRYLRQVYFDLIFRTCQICGMQIRKPKIYKHQRPYHQLLSIRPLYERKYVVDYQKIWYLRITSIGQHRFGLLLLTWNQIKLSIVTRQWHLFWERCILINWLKVLHQFLIFRFLMIMFP